MKGTEFGHVGWEVVGSKLSECAERALAQDILDVGRKVLFVDLSPLLALMETKPKSFAANGAGGGLGVLILPGSQKSPRNL